MSEEGEVSYQDELEMVGEFFANEIEAAIIKLQLDGNPVGTAKEAITGTIHYKIKQYQVEKKIPTFRQALVARYQEVKKEYTKKK